MNELEKSIINGIYDDRLIGTLILNQNYNYFEGKMNWQGKKIIITLGYGKDVDTFQKTLINVYDIFDNQSKWNKILNDYLIVNYLESANDWSTLGKISKHKLINTITLHMIYVDYNKNIEIYYTDGGIFKNKIISIFGNLETGLESTILK